MWKNHLFKIKLIRRRWRSTNKALMHACSDKENDLLYKSNKQVGSRKETLSTTNREIMRRPILICILQRKTARFLETQSNEENYECSSGYNDEFWKWNYKIALSDNRKIMNQIG